MNVYSYSNIVDLSSPQNAQNPVFIDLRHFALDFQNGPENV
jgi:hypothetical protein